MLTIILNTLADIYSKQWWTESNSTEDMFASMEHLNRVIRVKSLYPKLIAETSANIVNRMLQNSDLILVGMDWEKAAPVLGSYTSHICILA